MPDSERQARTPRIMRFPQPQDPDGRPCLPTNHPRSQPSWPWPPPRCWPAPGRSPRSPNGLPMRLSPSGPRWALAATSPATSPSPPRPPSAGPFPAWTSTRSPLLSAPGWPTGTGAPVPVGAGRRRAVAVDGKTLRGAHPPEGDGRPVHLLAAMDHTSRAVLVQHQVGGAPEVPAFAPLLAPLDLADVVVTADALQTHPEAAEFLVTSKQAHYLFVVKANQPTLLDRCQRLAWRLVSELDRTRDRGHGRIEIRTLKAVSVHQFGFPHAAQVLQVTRKTRDLRHHPRRCTTVTVYAITSFPHAQAGPARLADLIRGHWAIEALHHLRDTTFAEDGSQARTGATPNVMATLRNLVIGELSRAGPVNVAATPATPPTPRHPRDQPRMQPTSRQNDGALREAQRAPA